MSIIVFLIFLFFINPVSPISPRNPVNPISFYKPFFAPLRGQIGGPKGTLKGVSKEAQNKYLFFGARHTQMANFWGPKISTYFKPYKWLFWQISTYFQKST